MIKREILAAGKAGEGAKVTLCGGAGMCHLLDCLFRETHLFTDSGVVVVGLRRGGVKLHKLQESSIMLNGPCRRRHDGRVVVVSRRRG